MATATGLADEMLDAMHAQHPLVATLAGFRDRDDRLSDYSEAGEAATAARVGDIVARVEALDPAELSVSERLTCAVIGVLADAILSQVAARSVEYTITPLFVAPAAQLLFGLPMIGIVEPAQADGYLARLAGIPRMLTTLADRHRAGVAAGRRPVRRLVDAAAAHLDRYLANRDDNPLRRPKPPTDGSVDIAAFTTERDRLIDGVVRAAFAQYRTVLVDEITPHGRPDERTGLCWLPDGEGTYHRLIRAHTTVARSPAQLHRTGLDHIERLGEQYRSIGGRVFGRIGLPDLFQRLRTDPALRWRDGAQILATARTTIERAEQVAPQWFGRLPRHRCTVQAHERPRYTAEALVYHETIPGHHIQVALAQELTNLPLLRRLAPIDAFAEGWGLYAERLAEEMGLYTDDVARLGMLAGDSIRAARLVVDTGIHAHGWTRRQVTDFLRTNTPTPLIDIEQETDRYIANPGQALAYMVGRLEIDRIRAAAQHRLGRQFDIRGFHDTVLRHGEIPLDALADLVDEWVAAQSRRTGNATTDTGHG